MNLRISEGQLRFRIARVELEKLLGGAALELQVKLPQRAPRWRIELGDREVPLRLEEQGEAAVLHADRAALESLASRLPARKGIEQAQDGLLLVLEVDVRPSTARAGSA